MSHGRFREDLYYRFNVVKLKVPPLLAPGRYSPLRSIIWRSSTTSTERVTELGKPRNPLCNTHGRAMLGLRNCVESLVVLATHRRIERTDLPTHIQTVHPRSKLEVPLGSTLSQIEKGAILETLDMVGGNKHMAARVLGIGVKTLYRRLEEYRVP